MKTRQSEYEYQYASSMELTDELSSDESINSTTSSEEKPKRKKQRPSKEEPKPIPKQAPQSQSKPKPKAKPKAKRVKKMKSGFVLDEESIVECFEFLDSDEKGFVTQEDLIKTSRMFDVRLEAEQIDEMFDFALQSLPDSHQLNLQCFQSLMTKLNTKS